MVQRKILQTENTESDIVTLERQLSSIDVYVSIPEDSIAFLEFLYKTDVDVQQMDFKKKETYNDVFSKINKLIRKKSLSYCSYNNSVFKYKESYYGGKLFYLRMASFLRLYATDFNFFIYCFHKYYHSGYNQFDYSYEDFFGHEPFDSEYEESYTGAHCYAHFEIVKDAYYKYIKKHKYPPLRESFWYVPDSVLRALDNIFNTPDDELVFLPFNQKTENDCDFVQDSNLSVQSCLGITDYSHDNRESEMTAIKEREANDYYGNGYSLCETYYFIETDLNGKKYNNLSDMRRWKYFYQNFYTWEDTFNNYTEKLWKKNTKKDLLELISSRKFRLKPTLYEVSF